MKTIPRDKKDTGYDLDFISFGSDSQEKHYLNLRGEHAMCNGCLLLEAEDKHKPHHITTPHFCYHSQASPCQEAKCTLL